MSKKHHSIFSNLCLEKSPSSSRSFFTPLHMPFPFLFSITATFLFDLSRITVFLSPCFSSAAGRSWAAEARRRTSAASAPSPEAAASTRRVLPPTGHEWASLSPINAYWICLDSMAAWGPWPSHWARVSARTSGCWGTKSDQMPVRGNVSSCCYFISLMMQPVIILEWDLTWHYWRWNNVMILLATWKPVQQKYGKKTEFSGSHKLTSFTTSPLKWQDLSIAGGENKIALNLLHNHSYLVYVCVQNTAGVQILGWAASWRTQGETFTRQ